MWPPDAGQRIPCFDGCQLTMEWMSNVRVLVAGVQCMATMLCDVVVPVVVVHTHPQVIPLAILSVRKAIHGFQ